MRKVRGERGRMKGSGSASARVCRRSTLAACAVLLAPFVAQAQASPEWLVPSPAFPLADAGSIGGLTIRQRSATLQPFTVAGECGAAVGQGDGSFEAWAWPVKVLSHLHMSAQLEGYGVPIDVNDQSAEITVQPDRTTITFAHAAFTVREILFATRCTATETGSAPGVLALFQISSTKPLELTFSFTPEMKRMWPAPNFNAPSPEWVPVVTSKSGYYLLHTDSDELAGAVAMPDTQPGILPPYQERPKEYPLQLVLHYDPARDGSSYFPLLTAQGTTRATAARGALLAQLQTAGAGVKQLYDTEADYYRHFFDTRVVAETPDPRLNQALGWAEVSIDQLRVRHRSAEYGDEVALVAGLYSSGDSNRPGFGWFFGRDSLYTLFAADSYGDFALCREELNFLLKRQRADGKIMHEYSQTAELVDWPHLPYEYAAADSTPLLLMLLRDYAERSGDTAYLQAHWEQIAKAWQFERSHDSDGDGIYDNAQGTGWVESWPGAMPHQEVYLAALDVEASQAYAALAALVGKDEEGAAARAKAVAATLLREYQPESNARGGMYAFSYNGVPAAGQPKLDTTATIYPSVAWWDGSYALPGSDEMFTRWASHEFSTDWGTRDLGEHESFYDPMSYHQGSVWPLFTGWASLAEYRTGRPLAGYAHLMQNAEMSWAQDLGAVTELLSGRYFEPLGRSTTHQLWSSAMVLSPALRGLFGVSYSSTTNQLTVAPQLPADWDHATLKHVPVGVTARVTLALERQGGAMLVHMNAEPGATTPLPKLVAPGATLGKDGVLRVPLPGAQLAIPAELPLPGAETTQLKVLSQRADAHSATWVLEAQGSARYTLPLRLNGIAGVRADGARLLSAAPEQSPQPLAGDALLGTPEKQVEAKLETPGQAPRQHASGRVHAASLMGLEVEFPQGSGYVQQTVTLRW